MFLDFVIIIFFNKNFLKLVHGPQNVSIRTINDDMQRRDRGNSVERDRVLSAASV